LSEIDDAFHKRLYEEYGFLRGQGITWMGVGALKYPCDLWLYQEIMFELKPDLVIETGTHMGGSALFMAHMMDLIGNGRIVSIDLTHKMLKAEHPRVTFLEGSSTDPEIVGRVRELAAVSPRVMVVLDSDHTMPNVLAELDTYGPMVTPGSYMIVEDTNLNGHPVPWHFGLGAWEAVEEWLPKHPEFEADKTMERFRMTFNPGGYLKRIA